MTKRLTFDASKPADRQLFETLWDAIILGGSRGEVKTRQELRRWAAIERKLVPIGSVTQDYNPRFRPLDPLVLKPGVHTLDFEIGDIEAIEQRIEKVPWGGAQEIAAADLLDFLSTAPTEKGP